MDKRLQRKDTGSALKYSCDIPLEYYIFAQTRHECPSRTIEREFGVGEAMHIACDNSAINSWLMVVMTRKGIEFISLRMFGDEVIDISSQAEAVTLLMRLKSGVESLPSEIEARQWLG